VATELDERHYGSAAQLLAALRRRHLLTLDQLGERAAVAPAQLCRYEKGATEPSIATLRRILAAFGWNLTFGVEPTTAAADERLDAGKGPLQLLELDVIALIEIAACAAGDGAALVVGGEVAAVLQGVPVSTDDMVVHVHPQHVRTLARAAAAAHREIAEGPAGRLELRFRRSMAVVVPAEVLPPSTLASLDFAPWLARDALPVVPLDELCASGALRPAAVVLATRMAERLVAESIP